MSEISKYTWIVTRDLVLGDSSDAIGFVGPQGAKRRASFETVINEGAQFRMVAADGELQFSGYILGDYEGDEPLTEYGAERGCARIEYDWNGEWLALPTYRRLMGF